jgi:hypothetical protein
MTSDTLKMSNPSPSKALKSGLAMAVFAGRVKDYTEMLI